jgi:hypothetical protein
MADDSPDIIGTVIAARYRIAGRIMPKIRRRAVAACGRPGWIADHGRLHRRLTDFGGNGVE